MYKHFKCGFCLINIATNDDEKYKIAAMEAVFVYHTVKENQTFTSTNCMSKLIRTIFSEKDDFKCAETKAEAILSGTQFYHYILYT